ncbi:hypothetical protein [Paludisphaera sp.]|uniref:hypothetical protein n=1 Tax=Paludisphaera sp. TaxID=2017432 RepID=UPI00301E0A65
MRALMNVCGVLIVVLAALAARMAWTSDFDPEPSRGLKKPILGLELAATASEVRSVFRDPLGYRNRNVFRELLEWDGPFIICYASLLVGLGLTAAFRRGIGGKGQAALVIALAIGAARFDARENRGILTLIETRSHALTDEMAQVVRSASLAKWGCFFGAIGVISAIFLTAGTTTRGGRNLARSAGLLFLSASGLGAIGLIWPTMLHRALWLASLGFLTTLVMIAVWPDALEKGHEARPAR